MSDFECVCQVFEGDPCEFWKEDFVVAYKPHTCCECRENIQVGDLHQIARYKCEGEFQQKRTCLFCFDEREQIMERNPDAPWPPLGALACWLVAELRGDL